MPFVDHTMLITEQNLECRFFKTCIPLLLCIIHYNTLFPTLIYTFCARSLTTLSEISLFENQQLGMFSETAIPNDYKSLSHSNIPLPIVFAPSKHDACLNVPIVFSTWIVVYLKEYFFQNIFLLNLFFSLSFFSFFIRFSQSIVDFCSVLVLFPPLFSQSFVVFFSFSFYDRCLFLFFLILDLFPQIISTLFIYFYFIYFFFLRLFLFLLVVFFLSF